MADTNQKTNFRWVVITLLFMLNIISYIDRSAMAYAVKDMMSSLDLSFDQMGAVLGSFGVGYLITTFFGGIFVDRYGGRVIILVFALLWAVTIGATGLAVGFVSAYLARLGLGLGEGPNFPTVARTVADWLPKATRAKALANVLVAVPLSLAIAGPFVTFLLLAMDWRWMFIILAVMMLIWWPFWWFFYKNKPEQSRYVNAKEREYIEGEHPNEPRRVEKKVKGAWRFLCKNPTILSNNWGFFVFGYSMFFYLTWMPEFLEKSYHLNVKVVGLFSFLPWGLGAVFLWGVGYLSDIIYKRTKKLRYARSYPIMLGQLLSLLCLIPIIVWHRLDVTLISLSLAVAFCLSNNTAFYAINVDVAHERSASSLGLMNSGFAIAGFLAPMLTGWLVEISGSFHSTFLLIILLTLSSVVTVYFFHKPDEARLIS